MFDLKKLVKATSSIALLSGITLACGDATAPPPSATDLFHPDPNHDFNANTGSVQVTGLDESVVCFTTDGSNPEYNSATCSGGSTETVEGNIELDCGSDTSASTVRTIKIAFEWFDQGEQLVNANFLLDCSAADSDSDGDTVTDNNDNCPNTPNLDQADTDGNGIGDACEGSTEPDTDGDGRPDATDNCISVWNTDQQDNDNDGIGNVCDTTPEGETATLWSNDELVSAFAVWKEEVKCNIRCTDPSGGGDQGSWTCDNGGSASWEVDVSIIGSSADSYFTYNNCEHTVTIDVHDYATDPDFNDPSATVSQSVTLVVNGQMIAFSDFDGNGSESGTVTISGADFTGEVQSARQFTNKVTSGGSFSASCTDDPLVKEICAPNNASIQYDFQSATPHWICAGDICPAPAAALSDTDADGIFDNYDNCPAIFNPTQTDIDFDGQGDACDSSTNLDEDSDGVENAVDNCPTISNADQADSNNDNVGDACDADSDGIEDAVDNCPDTANADQVDSDNNGVGDACDVIQDWYLMQNKQSDECLSVDASSVLQLGNCDALNTTQQWSFEATGGAYLIRSVDNDECIARTSNDDIVTLPCDANDANQQMEFSGSGNAYEISPSNDNSCIRSSIIGSDVVAGLCGLAGSIKWGSYLNGDLSSAPEEFPIQ